MKEKLSLAWAVSTFGETLARSKRERAVRLVEEAIELAQSSGVPKGAITDTLTQVYSKPAGDLRQEVGGVIVTLASLCGLHGFKIDECFEQEFARCIVNVEKIREKNKQKVARFAGNED
jgi:NTP pyrophosphatase (non-canonical NTP hydrolase)